MAADIDIIVGAQDRASKILKDVERNTKQLTRGVTDMGRQTSEASNKMSMSFKGLAAAGAGAAAAVIAVKAAAKAVAGLKGAADAAIAAYNTQIEAASGLSVALRVNGEEVAGNTDRLTSFASQMQKLTAVGDEVTLGLMRQASMLGINAGQLDDAAVAAIGLAEATGKGLEESLQMARKAMQGDFGSLQEIIPALRDAANNTERLAMVNDLAAKGFAAKTAGVDRLTGAMLSSSNAVGDMQEQIGRLLEPIKLVTSRGIQQLAESITEMLIPIIDRLTSYMGLMAPVFKAAGYAMELMKRTVLIAFDAISGALGSIVDQVLIASEASFRWYGTTISGYAKSAAENVVAAMTFMEVGFRNLDRIVEVAGLGVALHIEKIRADLEHTFTGVLPKYIIWFSQNFHRLMDDAFAAVSTIADNFGKNLMARLTGGETTDLLSGFKASFTDLPKIADRQMTALQKMLSARMSFIGKEIGAEFTSKFSERLEMLNRDLKRDAERFKPNLDSVTAAINKGVGQIQAVESRLLTRGPSDDPMTKLVDTGKRQERFLQSIDKRLEQSKRAERAAGQAGGTLQVELIG